MLYAMHYLFEQYQSPLYQHDQILEALWASKTIDTVYTDFAEAFDKCDHGFIVHNLSQIDILKKNRQTLTYI